MKIDKLTKVLLAVIAINLTILTVDSLGIIAKAHAGVTDHLNPNYGMVPINEDGSINVRLYAADVVDVQLVGINESSSHRWEKIPIVIEGINTYEELSVSVGGQVEVCEVCN